MTIAPAKLFETRFLIRGAFFRGETTCLDVGGLNVRLTSKEMIGLRVATLKVMKTSALANLGCHQATPSEDVHAVRVSLRRIDDELAIAFRLVGSISGICLTAPSEPDGLAQLWRHTCLEVFIAIEGQTAYHEFNFAPCGAWRVYAFRAYRDPAPLAKVLHWPAIFVEATNERLELHARIVLTDLFATSSHMALRLGLAAVIESRSGSLSYWALRHPADKPDFHLADAFALRLEGPESK
jgi:hypothetical protein